MSTADNNEFDIHAIARAAKASINALADKAIHEIRLKHVEFMQSFDWEEEQRGRSSHLAVLLKPHDSIDSWWKSLSSKEKFDWIDTCHEYQYAIDGCGKIHENYFSHCVISYLSSRNNFV